MVMDVPTDPAEFAAFAAKLKTDDPEEYKRLLQTRRTRKCRVKKKLERAPGSGLCQKRAREEFEATLTIAKPGGKRVCDKAAAELEDELEANLCKNQDMYECTSDSCDRAVRSPMRMHHKCATLLEDLCPICCTPYTCVLKVYRVE